MNDTTWYSVYNCDHDSDYYPFETKDEALAHAKATVDCVGGDDGEIFVIPVPTEWYESLPEDAEWSLWDCLDRIPASDYIWIHCGEDRAAGRREWGGPLPQETADIVTDLVDLADDQEDDLGTMLTKAADEITRLREQVNETHRIINEQSERIIKMISANR
jgi:hypothetical protein